MAFNPYVNKSSGKSPTSWSTTIQLTSISGTPKHCDGLFNLYTSLGDVSYTGATTHTLATVLDGPERVYRFGALTVGDGSNATILTASQRCKGLVILCDSLLVRSNATLHMTGRGARVDRNNDPFFPFIDYKIPFKINLNSDKMLLSQALSVIKTMGLAPWDVGTFQHVVAGMFGFNCSIALDGSVSLLVADNCGVPDSNSLYGAQGNTPGPPGIAGGAGTNGGTGAGGTGGISSTQWVTRGRAGRGCPYGGGSGSGGACNNGYNVALSGYPASKYSGPGGAAGAACPAAANNSNVVQQLGDADTAGNQGCGGAGNPGGPKGNHALDSPGGEGCGGKLTIICRGTITVQSGGKIEANGMPGGSNGATAGGGGSGGGHISLISPNTVSNSGTIQAAGGAGGTGYNTANGGAGGPGNVNGSPVVKTFSDMGW